MQLLDKLQHERFDDLGRRAHHAATTSCALEFRVDRCHQLDAVVDAAIELQCIHLTRVVCESEIACPKLNLFHDDSREAVAQYIARLLEQRRRHHVRHQTLAVGQYERQQRT
jgi:hypothetical protein